MELSYVTLTLKQICILEISLWYHYRELEGRNTEGGAMVFLIAVEAGNATST